MERYAEEKLVFIARGNIASANVESFNVDFFDKNVADLLMLELKKINGFSELIEYCGGEGYSHVKEEIEEICGYKVVKNFFPIVSEYNFYYLVYSIA